MLTVAINAEMDSWDLLLRTTSGVVSGLSIVGATIVLFSYVSWCKIKEGGRNQDPGGWECRLPVLKALRYVFCNYRPPSALRRTEAHTQRPDGDPLLSRSERSIPSLGRSYEAEPFRHDDLIPEYHYFVIRICISDIITSSSHIWGITMNLNTTDFIQHINENLYNETIRSGHNIPCTAQAVVSIFGTIASFLWTLALLLTLTFRDNFRKWTNTYVMKNWFKADVQDNGYDPHCCDTPLFKKFLWPLFGWGIPAGLFTALAIKRFLGFTEGFDIAWCYLHFDVSVLKDRSDWIEDIAGYEVFVWGPLLLIVIFSVTFTTLLCCKKYGIDSCRHRNEQGEIDEYPVDGAHVRYMSIAIVLVILRIPNTISDIYILTQIHFHNYLALKDKFVAIVVLIAGMTNSAQGLVNAFMFICCTRIAGQFCRVYCMCCCRLGVLRNRNRQPQLLNEEAQA